ncbi:SDR family oxidoreductase [Streptomyces sp. NPDC058293]|uniref:SDR family oxidoreductase n=1 Tax=Streptomyces sp. NPDC058293 TaxID=3346429 RepID=UPI0036E57959
MPAVWPPGKHRAPLVAFTEALRKELLPQHVRVSVVEPGTVDTELGTYVRAELQEAIALQTERLEKLEPKDIADAVAYIVTRNHRVAVNEMLIRASAQTCRSTPAAPSAVASAPARRRPPPGAAP